MAKRYGFFVKIAGDIKKAVNVPVSAVGRIVDAEMAARVIESGMEMCIRDRYNPDRAHE